MAYPSFRTLSITHSRVFLVNHNISRISTQQWISRNLFTFGPMLIGTFLLKWVEEYPGKVCDIGFETPCISNKMQRYTVYFIWKLLYMFRAIPSPIIRSAMNGLRHPQHTQTSSSFSTIATDSSNCVTNTRCCRYSCLCS